jgi:hypothetical protein
MRTSDKSRSRWRRLRPSLALLALLPASSGWMPAVAADDLELQVKAAYLYNFARFTEWPRTALPDPPAAFRLCVLGKDPLVPVLEQALRGKTVNGRPLAVLALTSAGEAEGCHMLFIARSEQKRIKVILRQIAARPALTVSDIDNVLREGVAIQFRLVDQTVRFDVNLDASNAAGLKISSQMLKVALSTVGRRP